MRILEKINKFLLNEEKMMICPKTGKKANLKTCQSLCDKPCKELKNWIAK